MVRTMQGETISERKAAGRRRYHAGYQVGLVDRARAERSGELGEMAKMTMGRILAGATADHPDWLDGYRDAVRGVTPLWSPSDFLAAIGEAA